MSAHHFSVKVAPLCSNVVIDENMVARKMENGYGLSKKKKKMVTGVTTIQLYHSPFLRKISFYSTISLSSIHLLPLLFQLRPLKQVFSKTVPLVSHWTNEIFTDTKKDNNN